MPVPRYARRALAALVLAFVAMQFVRPERTNPPTDPSQMIGAHLTLPPDVKAVLDRSCTDCHTNDTRWPWYSHVAPASWLLVHDVTEGRDEMNFSEWSEYDREDAGHLLEEICEQLRDGAMPLPAYRAMHPSARMSGQEVNRLCQWTEAARKDLAAAAQPEPAPAGLDPSQP